MDKVECGSDDYVKATLHRSGGAPSDVCFANGGEISVIDDGADDIWVTRIWTGNNRVQWYGDGKWQPDEPIEKRVPFVFPNHPGGVKIEKLRIV